MTLGGRLGSAWLRIAADRALEWRGAALPRTASQLARVETIEGLLRQHGDGSLPRVRRVGLPGVRFDREGIGYRVGRGEG